MTAVLIDGRKYAANLSAGLIDEVQALATAGVRPGLATVLVGDSYPARAYERRVRRLAEKVGCHYVSEKLPDNASEPDALVVVGKLGVDPRVSGILILRPLPAQMSEASLYRALDPVKDIESVHPINAGLLALGRPRYVPSTPASVFHLLDRYLAESGRDPDKTYQQSNLVVVGRSANVGKPALMLAMDRGATVVSCDEHSHHAGLLFEHTTQADILIVAAGVAGLIRGEHVKDGVIAIDVGINAIRELDSGNVRLVGDIDTSDVALRAEAITPVPGGVGPITDVWLLRNTVAAARLAQGIGASYAGTEGLGLQGVGG